MLPVSLYLAKLNFLNLLSEKAKSLLETKKSHYVDSCDVAPPGYHIGENMQMSLLHEVQRTVLLIFLISGHCSGCHYIINHAHCTFKLISKLIFIWLVKNLLCAMRFNVSGYWLIFGCMDIFLRTWIVCCHPLICMPLYCRRNTFEFNWQNEWFNNEPLQCGLFTRCN